MNDSETRIIGAHGIVANRVADTWVLSVDPQVVAAPSPALASPANDGTTQLTFTGEHSETADDSAWSRAAQPGDARRGVVLTVQTGAAYNHAGDRRLYAFVRDLAFDAAGALASVSEERRITVDSPEACT